MNNKAHIEFLAISANECFARMVVAGFVTYMNPTMEELNDIRTAVSEAVTNAIVHGYEEQGGVISMDMELQGNELILSVKDYGVGISDINQAQEPLFTTRPEKERSGMGFAFMKYFMDDLSIESKPGAGTTVTMKKTFVR